MFEGYFLWNFLWNHLHTEMSKCTSPIPVEVGIWSPLFAILPRHPGEYLLRTGVWMGAPQLASPEATPTPTHQVWLENLGSLEFGRIYFRPRKCPAAEKWINSSVLKFKLTKDARDQVKFIKYPPGKLTYPTWGKGKSSTQKCLGRGYVSSLEGIYFPTSDHRTSKPSTKHQWPFACSDRNRCIEVSFMFITSPRKN